MRPTRPLVRLAALLLAALFASTAPRAALAQATGSVHGRAYAAADRAPIAYALIRLSDVGVAGAGRTALSDQQGAFAFAAVAPGTYRLSLERIGYATEVSEPFTVGPGENVERVLASRPSAIALAPLVATPECRTARDLDRNPRLAALWREARKAIETTRAFQDGYAYAYEQRLYWSTNAPDAPLDSSVSRVVNDPRVPWENRDRTQYSWGWGGGWGWANRMDLHLEVPDGREILDPAFLTTHCLEGASAQTDEVFELGFRPVRSQRRQIDIRGVMRVDRRTLQVKEIELEYMHDRSAFLEATIVYQDVRLPGGVVRLPAGMTFAGRPQREVLRSPVSGQVQFVNYSGLMKVDPAAIRRR
ncbi:MAG: carboxypeptidase-like regulatory domain-containing protein [Longimicrobiaceae bacterium]